MLSALAVLFFIYTGFAITLKKQRKKKPINPFPKDDCTYIVLVGTEGGTTRNFARLVHDELLRQGKKSFLAEMNRFTNYPQMEQLLIFTSTYGDGDAKKIKKRSTSYASRAAASTAVFSCQSALMPMLSKRTWTMAS